MVNSIPSCMVNEVINCNMNVEIPEVGMLGTYFVGSDRYAIVVVKVFSNKKILVLTVNDEDLDKKFVKNNIEYLPIDYTSKLLIDKTPKDSWYSFSNMTVEEKNEMVEWDLNRFFKEHTYTFRKNGRWIRQSNNLWDAGSIHLGIADPYLDPCF